MAAARAAGAAVAGAGFYQGWDLHPAQLPSRYAAVFAFYREGLPAAAARLRAYLERTGSEFLDEPATARALADFLVRAVDCGATDSAEVEELSGVPPHRLAVALARRAAGLAHRPSRPTSCRLLGEPAPDRADFADPGARSGSERAAGGWRRVSRRRCPRCGSRP